MTPPPADGLPLDSHFDGLLARHPVRPYAKFLTPDNAHLATPEALDWSERCRELYARVLEGQYAGFALGELADRCFPLPTAR